MKGRPGFAAVALAVIVAVVAGGCGGGATGDKAGGSGEPVVLRMASTAANLEYTPAIDYFVARLRERSGGNVRIEVVDRWGAFAADAEQQVVRAVASGKVDLGWSGARVFDTMGVTSFQALQAPMLIDSYALEQAVIASDIPSQMMQGLNKVGVQSLGILADGLRKPVAVKQPMLGLADWRGITFGTYTSQGQAQAIRALGATPMEVFGTSRDQALKDGKLQGFEMNLLGYALTGMATRTPYVTANVNLWPQMDVLLANPSRLAGLTGQQRAWLQRAAQDAVGRSAALADRDAQLLRNMCESGARFANASEADLAALREAVAPVHAKLKDNPQTKAFIEQIQAIKQATPTGAPLAIPAGCTGSAPAQPGAAQGSAAGRQLDGTYRWTITKREALANRGKLPGQDFASFPWTFTMTLKDGTWTLFHLENGKPWIDGPATYTVEGDRILFGWHPGPGLTFTFSVDDKGNLHLRPVEPMDAGDQLVWATHIWTKIG